MWPPADAHNGAGTEKKSLFWPLKKVEHPGSRHGFWSFNTQFAIDSYFVYMLKMDMGEFCGLIFHLLHVHTLQKLKFFMRKKTSDACYFIVTIQSLCDIIIVFWANSYFIFQMHHAKIFKMRYSKVLYKLFWKYESRFCSEVSKSHFTKYPWNHAFAGTKKKYLNQ